MSRKEREESLRLFLILYHEKIAEPCERAVRPYLTPLQFYALCAVNYYGPMTMTKLTQILNISKQNTTKLADKLIESGFCRRRADPADRRVILLEINENGKKMIEENFRSRLNYMLEEIERLGPQDRAAFFHAMETLNRLFEKMPKPRQQAAPSA